MDENGRQNFLGRGDMSLSYWWKPSGSSCRRKGSFISDEDVKTESAFVKNQAEADYDDSLIRVEVSESWRKVLSLAVEMMEEILFEEAKALVIETQASASMIQRRLSVGFNRALVS